MTSSSGDSRRQGGSGAVRVSSGTVEADGGGWLAGRNHDTSGAGHASGRHSRAVLEGVESQAGGVLGTAERLVGFGSGLARYPLIGALLRASILCRLRRRSGAVEADGRGGFGFGRRAVETDGAGRLSNRRRAVEADGAGRLSSRGRTVEADGAGRLLGAVGGDGGANKGGEDEGKLLELRFVDKTSEHY
jgi:hypothetical protein